MGKKDNTLDRIKKMGLTSTAGKSEQSYKTEDILISEIMVNEQIRKSFDPETLKELSNSINEDGLYQAIIVRKLPQPVAVPEKKGHFYKYELIAGERRLRACSKLGWQMIPSNIRSDDDIKKLIVQFGENIHREDLSNWEKANAVNQILKEVMDWGKLSNAVMYSKLLEIRDKKSSSGVTSTVEVSKIGVSIDTLVRYARMLAYPDQLIAFFEKNRNFPQRYIEQYYSRAQDNPEEVLNVFEQIVSGEVVVPKKKQVKKPVKEKSPDNIQVRILSKVKSAKKSVAAFVEENNGYRDNGTTVYYKDKEKVLTEIDEMKSLINQLESFVKGDD